MPTLVTMPVLSTTMEEGTVAEWLKREGEPVARDEPLLMVEMDKGTLEVPSPASGVLRRIVVQPGTTVAVQTLIAEIGEPGEVVDGPTTQLPVQTGQRMFITPRARKRARDLGIELGSLRGSGPHGRIVEADVVAAVEQGAAVAQVPPVQQQREVPADVQPLSRIRRITAERMAASAQATARVSLFLDADFSETTRFRQQLEPEFARMGVARLPWDAIVARAAALALAEHRHMLAQWVDGQGLRAVDDVNVGVAVTLEPDGLVVPVLRNADRRSLRELAADLLELVDKARAGRLGPAEMQGGGFSITNLGGYRIDGFTPILNPPESAILGVGRIAERVVVVDGAIAVRTMCTLSLSFDHRVVDGAPAAAFLARVAELLERPYALLGI
ncbi:MAG TPA: dihydrolipoamide acetyltransferase family protein [Chloroflexota bacterium]